MLKREDLTCYLFGLSHEAPQAGTRCPIETVTYYDIQEFIRRLSQGSRAGRFRLPTEAEWEYACRAGTRTPYSTGASLSTAQARKRGSASSAGYSLAHS